MKKFYLLIILSMIFSSCQKTEDLISPYHYMVIHKVQNFKIDGVDSTLTNKLRVKMSWTLPDTNNLRYFEIYRSQKTNDNFRIIVSNYKDFSFADSSLPSFKDSLKLFYLVYAVGNKVDPRTGTQVAFVGPPSDTAIITIKIKK